MSRPGEERDPEPTPAAPTGPDWGAKRIEAALSHLGGRFGVLLQGQVLSTFRGPIPPADEFAKYGAALPGAPDRLLRMAEEAQAHLHVIHERTLDGELRDMHAERAERRAGQVLGFVLAMTPIVTGGLVGGWFGALIGGTGIAGLASAYLQMYRPGGRRRPEPEASPSPPHAGPS